MTDLDPLRGRRPLPPPPYPVTESATTTNGPTAHRAPRPAARPRRRHPALDARILAAGIGMSTMLCLVASMGIAASASGGAATVAPPTAAPLPEPPSPDGRLAAPVPAGTAPSMPGTTSPGAADDPDPITLTARPDVRVITPRVTQTPAAPAPAATTHGSR